MNLREAKRTVTAVMALAAQREAERSRVLAEQIRTGAVEETRSAADIDRLARAYDELGSELARRVSHERRPSSPPIDPGQLSILEVL